ncbi:hypothetical protein D1B31_17965 [Neobacillus notoginsengisoli]|uniref:Uncharacterized protein n=1 Tax=Neobacillus notoginsengisoli TaxID=1578198 RepID=A0A417YPQ8_9BACI|nr:hypothetical protein [Neobacillus notoginsengisoli]RHW35975.1 hypothetical protein D1B31_17965 [Neobacillus notoginsengisoli]
MEEKKTAITLKKLAIASLIGEGEFCTTTKSPVLKVPFDRKKAFYLAELIKENNLINLYLEIDLKKGQFSLHSHPILEELRNQWYAKNKKVFSMVLDPGLLSLQAIIIGVNMFGTRKLESISIPTTTDKDHLKALSYCIGQHINVPVLPTTNQIKITNVPKFILNSLNEIPAIHSAELVNFLTEKEKKKIIEGALM